MAKETYGSIKDTRKHQQEDGIDEIDGANGNVEDVGSLIHPRPHIRYSDQIGKFNEKEADSLCLSSSLAEGDEHGFNQEVHQQRNNPVVVRSTELDVKETPPVERGRIGVENVCRVFVKRDGTLGNHNDFE